MAKPNNKEFIKVYLSSRNHNEVGRKLGMKQKTVASRANYLRKIGVNLPKLNPRERVIDVSELNEMILGQKRGTIEMGEVDRKPEEE